MSLPNLPNSRMTDAQRAAGAAAPSQPNASPSIGLSRAMQVVDVTQELAQIGWDQSNFYLDPRLSVESLGAYAKVLDIDVESMWKKIYGDPASWPTYYVDAVAGLNGNNGLSDGAAFATIEKAVQVANAGGVNTRIMVKGGPGAGQIAAGFYGRDKNFTGTGGTTFPSVNIAFYAYNGRVVCAASETDENLSWVADGTYSWVSSGTRSNALRIVDIKQRDRMGHYVELQKVADLATCSRTPNSWAQVSGTIKVNRADGVLASSANTRVYMSVPNFQHQYQKQCGFLFSGVTDADGFDFEGGLNGCVIQAYNALSQVPAQKGMTAFKNSSFRYAGGLGGTEQNNVSFQSFHGLAAFQGCDSSKASADGYNPHNTFGGTIGSKLSMLLINCTGFDNGRGSSISNNGVTGHEDVNLVSLCCDFRENWGSTAHFIDNSQALLVGGNCGGSLGDVIDGGAGESCELRAGNNSQLIARLVLVNPGAPSANAARVEGAGQILLRDCVLRGTSRVYGSGSISYY